MGELRALERSAGGPRETFVEERFLGTNPGGHYDAAPKKGPLTGPFSVQGRTAMANRAVERRGERGPARNSDVASVARRSKCVKARQGDRVPGRGVRAWILVRFSRAQLTTADNRAGWLLLKVCNPSSWMSR
jgi:hypothetical protein